MGSRAGGQSAGRGCGRLVRSARSANAAIRNRSAMSTRSARIRATRRSWKPRWRIWPRRWRGGCGSTGLHARTVQLKLRYSDFTTITRAHTLPAPTQLDIDLIEQSRRLLRTTGTGRRRFGCSAFMSPDSSESGPAESAGGRAIGTLDAGAESRGRTAGPFWRSGGLARRRTARPLPGAGAGKPGGAARERAKRKIGRLASKVGVVPFQNARDRVPGRYAMHTSRNKSNNSNLFDCSFPHNRLTLRICNLLLAVSRVDNS